MGKTKGRIYWDHGFHSTIRKEIPEDYVFYPKSHWYLFKKRLCWGGNFIFCNIKRLFDGFHAENVRKIKPYLKKGNVVLVANHCFTLDAMHLQLPVLPKRGWVTMIQHNLNFGPASWYFRNGGGVPIPVGYTQFKNFAKQTVEALSKGANVTFFPEGKITFWNREVNDFKPGAFKYAYEAHSVLIPAVFTFRPSRGWFRIWNGKRKPVVTLTYLDPVEFDYTKDKRDEIERVRQATYELIRNYQKEHNK